MILTNFNLSEIEENNINAWRKEHVCIAKKLKEKRLNTFIFHCSEEHQIGIVKCICGNEFTFRNI